MKLPTLSTFVFLVLFLLSFKRKTSQDTVYEKAFRFVSVPTWFVLAEEVVYRALCFFILKYLILKEQEAGVFKLQATATFNVTIA